MALTSGSVSFVHVVKAAEPLFSAFLSVIFLNSKLSTWAYISLIPLAFEKCRVGRFTSSKLSSYCIRRFRTRCQPWSDCDITDCFDFSVFLLTSIADGSYHIWLFYFFQELRTKISRCQDVINFVSRARERYFASIVERLRPNCTPEKLQDRFLFAKEQTIL